MNKQHLTDAISYAIDQAASDNTEVISGVDYDKQVNTLAEMMQSIKTIDNVSTSDVSLKDYNEANALQKLLQAMNDQLEVANEQFHINNNSSFSITIGGVSIAFILGGPQVQALCEFITAVSDENGYTVDFLKSTVVEE